MNAFLRNIERIRDQEGDIFPQEAARVAREMLNEQPEPITNRRAWRAFALRVMAVLECQRSAVPKRFKRYVRPVRR